jgi:hypothetical protein
VLGCKLPPSNRDKLSTAPLPHTGQLPLRVSLTTSSQFTQSKAVSNFTKFSSSKAGIAFMALGGFADLFLILKGTNLAPSLATANRIGHRNRVFGCYIRFGVAALQSGSNGITPNVTHITFNWGYVGDTRHVQEI